MKNAIKGLLAVALLAPVKLPGIYDPTARINATLQEARDAGDSRARIDCAELTWRQEKYVRAELEKLGYKVDFANGTAGINGGLEVRW